MSPADRVWLFDLDNTLHDAGAWVFKALHQSMGDFTAQALQLDAQAAQDLNHHYWHRYGATLLGLGSVETLHTEGCAQMLPTARHGLQRAHRRRARVWAPADALR